jgi:putative phage-type endonuclease
MTVFLLPTVIDEILDEDFLLDLDEEIFIRIDEYMLENKELINDLINKEKTPQNTKEKIQVKIASYITDYVENTIELLYEIEDFYNDLMEEEDHIYSFVKDRIDIYFEFEYYLGLVETTIEEEIPRSIKMELFNESVENNNTTILAIQIEYLKNQPQPQQKTQEWYELRNTLMTASNIYKIFGTQAQYNSFICEKCDSSKTNLYNNSTNTETTLHWGNKYEPLSIKIYELKYNTKVEEFGCIKHAIYPCIGASPDGIVTGETHFGRMIEVKNIVNRKITGNPLEAYWVQMQMQMEVCNLNVCNFIETRFKECQTNVEWNDLQSQKGAIISVSNYGELPKYHYYIYTPELATTQKDFIEKIMEERNKIIMENDPPLINIIWWYLDEFSCVVVPRNKKWFETAVPKILNVWDVIIKEREEGYSHRLPKKKTPKCLINIEEMDFNNVIKTNENDDTRLFYL